MRITSAVFRCCCRSAGETAVSRKHSCLCPALDTESFEYPGERIAHGLFTDEQRLPNLRVSTTRNNCREDLAITRRECAEEWILAACSGRRAREVEHGLLEHRPGRLVLQQNMVA